MGDIERDLLALYPASATSGLCGSAMAFRRLRAALPQPIGRTRPGASLASVAPGAASRSWSASLVRDGLHVSASRGGVAATIGCLAALAALLLLAPLVLLAHAWAAAVLMVAGIALVAVDRGTPRDMTLGELTRETAAMNFAHFVRRGADRRAPAIFDAVRRVLAATAPVDPNSIGRETRLIG